MAQINPEKPLQSNNSSNSHRNQFRKLNFIPKIKVGDSLKSKFSQSKRKNIVVKISKEHISYTKMDEEPLLSEEKHEIKIPTQPLAEVITIGKQKVESDYRKAFNGRKRSNKTVNHVDQNITLDFKMSKRRKQKPVTEKQISHQSLLRNFSNKSIKRIPRVYSKRQYEFGFSNGLRIYNPALNLYGMKNQRKNDTSLAAKHLRGE